MPGTALQQEVILTTNSFIYDQILVKAWMSQILNKITRKKKRRGRIEEQKDVEDVVRMLEWEPSGLTQALGEWEKHTTVNVDELLFWRLCCDVTVSQPSLYVHVYNCVKVAVK